MHIRASTISALVGAFAFLAEAQEHSPEYAIVPGTLKIYGNDSYPTIHRRAQPVTSPRARYPGFKPGTTLLKKGTVRREGALVLPCDIIFERDVAVKMRDGITMYTDVFRPTSNETVPGIIGWGPYGKQIGGQWLQDVPGRAGVPLNRVSEFQKFESPDPGYWVCKGYTILNPDSRGAYWSEGNITYWGRQLAEDGYDFVEWAAKQPWSNGKLTFSGNSYLAISQWFIAAENPPHLAAIAPWEGFYDSYREASRRGGIAQPAFGEEILQSFAGKNFMEDHVRMQLDNDLMNPYWEDKIAKLEKINVPAYIVASYTSPIHTHGSFEGFRQINTKDKWLRVHNSGEWPDYYEPGNVEDLRKFYDHFLKGIDNGWEKTPRVRYSILNPGGKDEVNRETTSWPPPEVQKQVYYLQADMRLAASKPVSEAKVEYDIKPTGSSGIQLMHKVTEPFELVGYSKVRLWVEAVGSDDMELTIDVSKADAQGKPIQSLSPFAIAAAGLLRVSHRELDLNKSTEYEPFHLHRREQLLKAGEIVQIDVPLWPMALKFNAGEHLVLSIAGTVIGPVVGGSMFGNAVIPLPADGGSFVPGTKNVTMQMIGGPANTVPAFVKEQGVKAPASRNKGSHVIHLGGKYDSHLLMPIKK